MCARNIVCRSVAMFGQYLYNFFHVVCEIIYYNDNVSVIVLFRMWPFSGCFTGLNWVHPV